MSALEIPRGKKRSYLITVRNPDGSPYDLTGKSLRFVVTAHPNSFDDSLAAIVKTIGAGLVIVGLPTAGLVQLNCVPVDTISLNPCELKYELQVATSSADPEPLDRGNFRIIQSIVTTVP